MLSPLFERDVKVKA